MSDLDKCDECGNSYAWDVFEDPLWHPCYAPNAIKNDEVELTTPRQYFDAITAGIESVSVAIRDPLSAPSPAVNE